MKKKIYLTLDIDESIKDVESLKQDIEAMPEVDEVDEESGALGVIEAIAIALAAKLLYDLLKKVTPVVIKKFKKVIKKILEKREKKSTSPKKGKLTLHYEVLTLDFTLGDDEGIDKNLEKFRKYISG